MRHISVMTFTTVTVTAELEIETAMIDDHAKLEDELLNQMVKIKSGAYEDAVVGYITSVKVGPMHKETVQYY